MQTKLKGNKTLIFSVLILFTIIVLIKTATYYPAWVEGSYSNGIYPSIAAFYRMLFGWFPLSVGDLLYLAVLVYMAEKLFRTTKIIWKRRWHLLKIRKGIVQLAVIFAIIYIFFNVSWGLNYNRLGIAYQLQLQPHEHSVQDLQNITGILIQKLNSKKSAFTASKRDYPTYTTVFEKSYAAYQSAAKEYQFIRYSPQSIKRSLYGRAGIYLGFLGYYNPFTGEAQLNLTQPRFLIPFVTCHEVAHQLGYASESEANFVGYLAAVKSGDPLFEYSAYFDLFNYANRELYNMDTAKARNNVKLLDTLVKKDMHELREYYKKSDNVLEPFIKTFYDSYLKANQQKEGVKSYNEVVGWLIAYYKKYGKI
jgi:hypothetical protein